METIFTAIFGAVLGAASGSYLGCAAYRLPRRIPLAGRSGCPSCGRKLAGWQNIPVISWLLLRGRSACCDQPIAFRYLLIEIACAVAGAAVAVLVGWKVAFALTIAVILITYLLFVCLGLPQINGDQDVRDQRPGR